MRAGQIIMWAAGLWLATGVEAAVGDGVPGPLLLLALAAGLQAGAAAGLLVGFGAGLCAAVVSGQSLLLFTLLGMGCGVGASALSRWFSRQHLVIGLVAAFLATSVLTVVFTLSTGLALPDAIRISLQRGMHNALWMVLIYGIVLLAYRRCSIALRPGNLM